LSETFEFLIRHGYSVVFLWVLGEQLGLPLPATPVLLAAGALAGAGKMNLGISIALAVIASLLGDVSWYAFGRVRGGKVLNLLCRISLEPDSCVRKTENAFVRHGARSLLIAKFVPGLNTMAPPLAGIIGMRLSRFLIFDALGAFFYIGSAAGVGYVFSDQLEEVAARVASYGFSLLAVLVGALAAYILWKYIQRRRFIRSLRIARITPEDLNQKIEAGESVVVVDLRHSLDFDAKPQTIPGAIRLAPEEIEQGHGQIPRDRDIVLFCT
jgi:membrane protein DedA with SNARE-associated domain